MKKIILFALTSVAFRSQAADMTVNQCIEKTRAEAQQYIQNNFPTFEASEFQCGQLEAKKFTCIITGSLPEMRRTTLTIQFVSACEPSVQE